MATLSSDGKYVTVEKGDTLWNIAEKHLGSGVKYKQLAAINGIPNPDRIYVGQKIYLTSDGSSTTDKKSNNSNRPTVTQFGLISNVDNTLFATWSWSKDNTESYKVLWTYDTGDNVWFVGNNSTINVFEESPSYSKQSTYSIPSGAKRVKFQVRPISKKKTKNGTETSYWTAEWSTAHIYKHTIPLETPNTPDVKIEKYTLTATLTDIKANSDGVMGTGVEFEIVKNNTLKFKTGRTPIRFSQASYSCEVDADGEYKVRCRVYNGNDESDWSGYSGSESSVPATPSSITKIRAEDEKSVLLEWVKSKSAKTYDIEYATKKEYFDVSGETKPINGVSSNTYLVTSLETGKEYFFRVRAVNESGESDWSEIKSVIVGTDPAAPTTWSSTTVATKGEDVNLYWVHNSEDGSIETFAELEMYIDGAPQAPYILGDYKIDSDMMTYVPLSEEDKEDGKVNSLTIHTEHVVSGGNIKWRIRTAGITKVYGDWSIQRTIDIYEKPSIDLSITDMSGNWLDTITSFPFIIKGVASPKEQSPIGYHLSIVSNSTYETTDKYGNDQTVNVDEEIYSRYFDTFQELLVEFSAGNIDLENNISYTAICKVAMNSGLSAESSRTFTVAWSDMDYLPNCEIGIDPDSFTAYIQPYCEEMTSTIYKVIKNGDEYLRHTTVLTGAWGDPVPGAKTNTGIQVYQGVDTDGNELYYCTVEARSTVTDVLLSVYRREFDGSFTEIATNLDASINITVTDPHPSLDLARYRVVATSKDTGSVSYYDVPGYPVGGKAAIIQWDETWTDFETTEESSREQPPWSGSLLKLPYNIDVSDNMNPDVARIEYVGREHPVAYYGTQLGHTSNWSMVIEKADKEALYALRRLQRWMGDVYVREPSGSGYWASVTVSFSQKHCETTIPVTLSVTRVEGGV